MKKQIFLYLFLFSVLIIVFLFMNSKRKFEKTEQEKKALKTEITDLEHQNDSLKKSGTQGSDFTIKNNDKAREFFQSQGVNPDSLAQKIQQALLSKNKADEDNALLPYAGVRGIMRINRVQVLNNRWVLAEFTDSVYWGEALISYRLKDNGELAFETLDGILYPN